MSLLSAVKTFVAGYSGLPAGASLVSDGLIGKPGQYAVLALPGRRVAMPYVDGGSEQEFHFALSSVESTVDELQRLASSGWYESFAEWLDVQTIADNLPVLGVKQSPISIEAVQCAFIYEQGNSGTGVYQIQCKLVFHEAV